MSNFRGQSNGGCSAVSGIINPYPSDCLVVVSSHSKVTITLEDVSLMDAPSKTIATQVVSAGANGRPFPIRFQLAFDPKRINPRATYSVSVRVSGPGKEGSKTLLWISDTANNVLTRGAPCAGVEVLVKKI
ncbi:hypothetical protein B0O80DRAFT_465960 [Mortierella sp. GBAus27b]|nr:hypothetical protein B0O80DRAFT_465960 [Mortierella sp. GBAus27b]